MTALLLAELQRNGPRGNLSAQKCSQSVLAQVLQIFILQMAEIKTICDTWTSVCKNYFFKAENGVIVCEFNGLGSQQLLKAAN